MAKINSNRPIIRLNINYINIPIKRQRLTEKMKKKKPNYQLPTKNSLKFWCSGRLKVKGWKKLYHENINQSKSLSLSDTTIFRAKKTTKDRNGHSNNKSENPPIRHRKLQRVHHKTATKHIKPKLKREN